MRRFPVYFLLDTSKSMRGEKIEAVQNGMQIIHSTLRKNPYALESAYLSVITFGSDVKQVVPPTDVALFQMPTLTTGGATSLGGALKMVTECANREVQRTTAEERGDWKPFVFLMTDGYPTDDFQSGLNDFKTYRWGQVVALAAGCNADISALEKITKNVIRLEFADATTIGSCFSSWYSCFNSGSYAVDCYCEEEDMQFAYSELPAPPPEIVSGKP